jgi:hypothetical protein
MPTQAQQLLRENYGRVVRDLVTPLLDLMTEANRVFAGDAEKFHILLVLALRMAEHPDAGVLDLAAIESGRCTEFPALASNVKSIAASIGIPEETVRRKVRALVRDGWIARQGNALTYTAKAAQELSSIRRLIIRGALQNHQVVARLLAESEG